VQNLHFWYWWILAGVLLAFELMTFTTYLLWLGIAAGLTGLVVLLIAGLNDEWQLILFAILAVLCMYTCWRYLHRKPLNREQENLNQRSMQLIGRMAVIETAVENGVGKVKLGDTVWQVTCDADLPVGTKVKVLAVDDTVLKVVAL
jgi:membrane protein implicated in regulation of membrane protease activity